MELQVNKKGIGERREHIQPPAGSFADLFLQNRKPLSSDHFIKGW
jgi:hypothetical protein